MNHILVIGCGYAGERIARLHRARGDAVTGITRDADRAARLRAIGVDVMPVDLDGAGSTLPGADRVYYLAPPPASGRTDPRLANALDLLPPPTLFAYFSTTGVYGDCEGALVDESRAPAPGSDRARRRLDAEDRARAWCSAFSVVPVILRVAAIYGPGRLPLERLIAGAPVPDSHDPGNRIHVDDLAAAAVAVADAGKAGTWNVGDGNFLSVADFSDRVADAAGIDRPPRVAPDAPEISAGMREFLRDSRRVDNRKLQQVPGFRLRYADPAEGIRASLEARPG